MEQVASMPCLPRDSKLLYVLVEHSTYNISSLVQPSLQVIVRTYYAVENTPPESYHTADLSSTRPSQSISLTNLPYLDSTFAANADQSSCPIHA